MNRQIPDPFRKKDRYLSRNFREKLNIARKVPRRTAKPKIKIFTSGKQKAIAGIGIFLVVFYLVYFFPYFRISNIRAKTETQQIIEKAFTAYVQSTRLFPTRNIFFFSKKKFSKYLLDYDQNIRSVNKVKKKFPHTLEVDASLRTAEFFVSTPLKNYTVSQDKVIMSRQELFINASASTTPEPAPANLFKIETKEPDPDFESNLLTASINLNGISRFASQAEKIFNSPPVKLQTTKISAPSGNFILANGTYIKTDLSSNYEKLAEQLQALVSKLNTQQAGNISYIDARIPNKAFVCFKSLPCQEKESEGINN